MLVQQIVDIERSPQTILPQQIGELLPKTDVACIPWLHEALFMVDLGMIPLTRVDETIVHPPRLVMERGNKRTAVARDIDNLVPVILRLLSVTSVPADRYKLGAKSKQLG